MKILSKIALLVVLISSVALTHNVSAGPACIASLQWQSSPDPAVAGYALYYGLDGYPLTNRVDVGLSTAVTVKNLVASSTYFFYVVAYDSDQGESDPSNFLLYTAPAMSSLRLSQNSDGTMNLLFHVAPGAVCHVEYTDTLTPANWTVLTLTAGDSNGLVTVSDPTPPGDSRFYRAVIP